MRTRCDVIVVLLASACSGVAAAQSFVYGAQERSVYYRVGTTSESLSAPNFNAWNATVATNGGGSNRAYSIQHSDLRVNAVEFSGEVWTSSGGPNQSKGVFDVMFTLTAATQVQFVWGADNMWNLTLWTPTWTRILATAAQSGKFGTETLFFEAGNYRLRADADVANGAAGNAGFQLTIVPAPASLAVLGVVSVFAARRRR